MADPKKEEKTEKKVEETRQPTQDNELTDADAEKVAGGGCQVNSVNWNRQ
jgi:hypothetical protein